MVKEGEGPSRSDGISKEDTAGAGGAGTDGGC